MTSTNKVSRAIERQELLERRIRAIDNMIIMAKKGEKLNVHIGSLGATFQYPDAGSGELINILEVRLSEMQRELDELNKKLEVVAGIFD